MLYFHGKQTIDKVNQVIGKILPQADEAIMQGNEKVLAEPVREMNQKLAEEGQKFDDTTRFLAQGGQVIGNMVPSMLTSLVTKNPQMATAVMASSVKGMSTQEALEKGATLQEAVKVGNTKATVEVATELLTGGINIFGKGAFDEIIDKKILGKINNEVARFFVTQGINAGTETIEELTSDALGVLIDKGTVDPNATISPKDMKETALLTTLTTTVLNILTGGMYGDIKAGMNRNNMRNQVENANISQEQKNDLNKKIAVDEINNEELSSELFKTQEPIIKQLVEEADLQPETKQAVLDIAQRYNMSEEKTKSVIDYAKNTFVSENQQATMQNKEVLENGQQVISNEGKIAENQTSKQPLGNDKYAIKMPDSNFKFEKTGNKNEDILDESMSKSFNNSEDTHKLNRTLKKIMKDKNLSIVFDENITDQNGNIVDGKYENGVITINPNSTKAFEYVATHELTHAIGTKEMLNMVQKYRESNKEFNTKLETILKNYNKSELTEEALADVSAELFGTQEFIANVKNTNPNLFQKIYNEIKYLWHQFRGYKNQNQFVEDLYNKWTQAYNSNAELNQTTRNLNIGLKGYENAGKEILKPENGQYSRKYRDLTNNVRKAVKMAIDGKSGEEILKATNGKWTKNTENNQVMFNISDKDIEVVKPLQKNSETTLGEIIDHPELFFYYPELQDMPVVTERIVVDKKDQDAYYSDEERNIHLHNDLIRDVFQIKTNLIHEIQHAIQDIEGTLTREKYSLTDKEYLNNILEIEADDQVERFIKERKGNKLNKLTEINKKRPSHSEYRKKNIIEKIPVAMYNIVNGYDGVVNQNETNREFLKSNSNNNINTNSSGKIYNRNLNTNNKEGYIQDTKRSVEKGYFSKSKKETEGLEESSSFNLQKDNKGRTLSKEQQEYFKDSKVRDEKGHLLEVYHGTKNSDFTIFDKKRFNTNEPRGDYVGEGFFFHNDINKAKSYGNEIKKAYLNIKNPLIINNEQDGETFRKQFDALYNPIDETEKKFKTMIPGYSYFALMEQNPSIIREYLEQQGYDGLIDNDYGQYAVFNSNQIKNVDNTNPTDNPDIRYSKQNAEWYDYIQDKFKTEGTRTTKEQIKLPEKNVLQENTSNLKQTTTKKETDTEIAKVLNTPVTRQKPQDRKWAIFKASVFDKGIVFEDLSKRAKNRELEAKWDYTLSSSARAQYAIGNARLDENGNKISKGLTEIIDEVGDKIDDFQNYMYHLLNIDRMSLKERFGIDNKPVFGKNIGKDYSERKVEEFEKANPKFKEWAQDVYDYANADKAELVKNGVISQELSDKFAEMYPHYVPIQRANKLSNAINLPLDTRRTGVNTPIKQAKGGSSDLNPLFETLAGRTMQTYRASARNSLGVELKNTLESLNSLNSNVNNAESLDSIMDTMADEKSTSDLLQASKDGKLPTFTVFENGNKVTFDISEDIYDALKPVSKALQGNYLWGIPNKLSNLRRAVLTEYNLLFSITNTVKDTQDVLLNSQHAYKTYKKYPEAYWQIMRNGYWKQEYIQNGGEQNTYFKDGEFEKVTKKGLLKQVVTFPLDAISRVNGALEMAPRLAEYIASREEGRSIQTSMLDASRVTTNFKAGGDVTKALNRNGFTFLNAGVQGAMQAVRNVREANVKGLKGWTMLACKMAVAGAPVLILNNLMWEDDDDYEQLQDYVKDGYYIIGKRNDGTFIRLPKGRTLAVIQKVVSNVDKYINNEGSLNIDEVSKDFWETAKFTIENLAPSNPLDNNVISPIIQTITNTSWYGEDIVPSRLQNVPNAEQFDETTDKFSKWLGEKTGVSPMKINYLLDQYGGGVSDVLLPLGTPQAENTPLEDKFVTDPIMKSKYPGEFFDKADKLEVASNSMFATDADIVKGKFMSDIQSDMSELYKEKRKIQNSDTSDEYKKIYLKDVQEKINDLAKESMELVDKAEVNSKVAIIGDKQYYKDDEGKWQKIKESQIVKGLDTKTYADYKNKTSIATDKKRAEKDNPDATLNDSEKSQILLDSSYTEKEKKMIYENYIGKDDTTYSNLKILTGDKVNIEDYLGYKTADLKAEDNPNSNIKGKTISGSKKKKVVEYLNNSKFSGIERLYIYGTQYSFNNSQKQAFVNYVESQGYTDKEKHNIYKKLQDYEEREDGAYRLK